MLKRRRRGEGTALLSATPRCQMCGVDNVVVDAAGRCPLGHFVGAPVAAEPPVSQWQTSPYAPEPGAMFTLPEPDATQALTPVVSVDDTAPLAPAPQPADDDILAGALLQSLEPVAGIDTPVWGETFDEAASAHNALDELLTWSDTDAGISALDVETVALPVAAPLSEPAPVLQAMEPIAAPDDDVEDAAHARVRAAGLLGGGLFVMAALAGSVAILPPL